VTVVAVLVGAVAALVVAALNVVAVAPLGVEDSALLPETGTRRLQKTIKKFV
jgi:uncharacterized membrane protein